MALVKEDFQTLATVKNDHELAGFIGSLVAVKHPQGVHLGAHLELAIVGVDQYGGLVPYYIGNGYLDFKEPKTARFPLDARLSPTWNHAPSPINLRGAWEIYVLCLGDFVHAFDIRQAQYTRLLTHRFRETFTGLFIGTLVNHPELTGKRVRIKPAFGGEVSLIDYPHLSDKPLREFDLIELVNY